MFKRRSDRIAAFALPLILGASVFMGTPAEASHEKPAKASTYPLPKYYQAYEECVRIRESNGHWRSRNPSRKYLGAYQMHQELANGATYWMVKRGDIARYLGTGDLKEQREFAEMLRFSSVHTWDPWLQTAAFRRTLDGHAKNKPWSGKFHWAGGRWSC
jgi:hypothetical protein